MSDHPHLSVLSSESYVFSLSERVLSLVVKAVLQIAVPRPVSP